jgi:hypothetical protein
MATQSSTTESTAAADHGWFGTGTVQTRLGSFHFKNSYPSCWKPDDITEIK